MSGDQFRLLIETFAGQFSDNQSNPTGTVAILISETLKLRDKLKEEAGIVLTVEDTRVALEALEARLKGQPLPKDLSGVQKELSNILFERLTLFGGHSS